MTSLKVKTQGLILKEVRELTEHLSQLEGVGTADYAPDILGKMQYRSPQAAIPEFIIVLRLAESAAIGIGIEASKHFYKRIGEALVDRTVDWLKLRLTGRSVVEAQVVLYGPDDKLLEKVTRTR